VNFKLAAVARSCIDLPNRETPTETRPRSVLDRNRKLFDGGFVLGGCPLRERTAEETLKEKFAHRPLLKVMSRIGTIERLVAKRKIGDDVVLDYSLQQRPLEP
jgi:hypothetical protein